MKSLVDWYLKHRTDIGAFLLALSGLLIEVYPECPEDDICKRVNRGIIFVGGALYTSGRYKSDRYHADVQKASKEGSSDNKAVV